jgi:hypothetical protein
MKMIDEQDLREALQQSADEFEISTEATNRILDEARVRTTSSNAWRPATFVERHGQGRLALAAAASIIVVGALSVPLFLGEQGVAHHPIEVFGAIPKIQAVRGTGYLSVTGLPKSGALSDPTAAHGVTVTSSGSTKSLAPRPTADSAASLSPKIESTGSVNLRVAKGQINAALSTLGDLATKDGGYVFSTRANAGNSSSTAFSSATIVLQVPQHAFATLVAQAQRAGHATAVNTSSANVTGQYVNLQARISALQASRQQYLAIMKRATSISGILAVQNQLDNLQSQIEQYQGQLNVLSHETTYASLTVLLAEEGHHVQTAHHESGLRKAWHDSVGGFVAGFEWLIRLAGPVVFALLFLGAVLGLGRLGWRASRRRRL